MFDKVAIPDLNSILHPNEIHLTEETEAFLAHMEWLLESGVICPPEELLRDSRAIADSEYVESVKQKIDLDHNLEGLFNLGVDRSNPLYRELFIHADYLETRYTAIQLRELGRVDAYPVYYTELPSGQKQEADKTDIVQIALNALPVPDESTSWEQIAEYRSDTDSQSKFLALRHWMSEVARAELAPAEVEEKLEYLIDQYRQHMKLHRMKTNVGTLETIVTTGAEILGDLVSFKWGKAAEALFSLKKRKVTLLEGELTAPGNEVAYIVKARETFS